MLNKLCGMVYDDALSNKGNKRKHIDKELKFDETAEIRRINHLRKPTSQTTTEIYMIQGNRKSDVWICKSNYSTDFYCKKTTTNQLKGGIAQEYKMLSFCRQNDISGVIQVYGIEEHENRTTMYTRLYKCDMLNYISRAEVRNMTYWKRREKVLRYAKELTRIIMILHAHNIIHRDIKLENILYDFDRDTVVVSDFGYGRFCGVDDIIYDCAGTSGYLCPSYYTNAYMKRGVSGKKADVYSTGVTLWCMLFDTYPYVDKRLPYEKLPSSMLMHKNDEFVEIILQMIRPDQNERVGMDTAYDRISELFINGRSSTSDDAVVE